LGRRDLDLSRVGEITKALDRLDPSIVINCAAYTAVDRAESEENLATLINGEAVGQIGKWAKQRDRPLLTFSTDYVFDGAADRPYVESSSTNPINAYGRSKLVGESLALGLGALVVRTSWVISGSHPNFVATILRKVKAEELRVVDDQRGNPTVAADLARASYAALRSGVTGLVHLTNQGETTWYELARTSVGLAGLDPSRISPCETVDYPTPAPRPGYSVLASERLEGIGLEPLPHWRESIGGVVGEIKTWI
jgi:dTDP-4-dehydrorhamnose reductase